MDAQFQPSFIPKKPLNGPVSRHSSTAMGTFIILICALIFVASLVTAGAAFAYQGYLTSSIAQKADTLKKAEAAFDPSTINDLTRLDARINNGKDLLGKHITTLALFNFLSQQTLLNVQFTSFSLELKPDGSGDLTLAGEADGFSTVALQSDQLGASKMLKDVVFSNIVVSSGKVGFNVKATVDPSLLSYSKNLSGGTLAPLTNFSTTTQGDQAQTQSQSQTQSQPQPQTQSPTPGSTAPGTVH